MIDLDLFFDISRDVAMATDFVKKVANSPLSSHWHSAHFDRQVRRGQKTSIFRRISPDMLDRFSQSFHHMKALYVEMMDLYLIFQFVKEHTLPWQPNNVAVMKAN